MNLVTLGDAVSACSRFVENGAGGCDQPLVVNRINEACSRLLAKGDWPYSMLLVRARVDNWTFPLPAELEAIRAINIDNTASTVNSPYFRFMDAGPGEERSWSGTGAKSLDDLGLFPLMYDIPSIERPAGCRETDRTFASSGLRIMAFSTAAVDGGKTVSIAGLGKYNAETSGSATEFSPMEEVRILPWDGVEGSIRGTLAEKPMSANAYRTISAWAKPETAGYVSLYAVDPETSRMWFLAKAHPFDTRPAWRRYHLRGQTGCGSNILIYGKMGDRKLRALDDILPIQNLPSVKHMVQAIEFENKQQLKSAVEYEAQAIRLLSEQKSNHDSQGPQVNVIDFQVALSGRRVSRHYSR